MIPRFSSFLFSGLTLIFVLSSCASDDGFQVFKQQSQEDLVEVVEQINPGPGSPGENPGDPITPPPANPNPSPNPNPPPSGDPIEEAIKDFDIDKVTWLHTNVKDWAKTSNLTQVDVSDRQICLDHTKKGRWPTREISPGVVVEGNPWVIVKFEGKWYAATYEWLRPGQVCKTMGASPPSSTVHDQFASHIKVAPLNRWRPKKGEVVGFMVSALARSGAYRARERTQIEFVLMP